MFGVIWENCGKHPKMKYWTYGFPEGLRIQVKASNSGTQPGMGFESLLWMWNMRLSETRIPESSQVFLTSSNLNCHFGVCPLLPIDRHGSINSDALRKGVRWCTVTRPWKKPSRFDVKIATWVRRMILQHTNKEEKSIRGVSAACPQPCSFYRSFRGLPGSPWQWPGRTWNLRSSKVGFNNVRRTETTLECREQAVLNTRWCGFTCGCVSRMVIYPQFVPFWIGKLIISIYIYISLYIYIYTIGLFQLGEMIVNHGILAIYFMFRHPNFVDEMCLTIVPFPTYHRYIRPGEIVGLP